MTLLYIFAYNSKFILLQRASLAGIRSHIINTCNRFSLSEEYNFFITKKLFRDLAITLIESQCESYQFLGGIEGAKYVSEAAKVQNLPKMAYFSHYFLVGGGWSGGQMHLCPP